MKTRDVILILFDGVEGDRERQIREAVWMPFCWLIGISYSLKSKSAMRCCRTRTRRSWESWSWSEKPVVRDGFKAVKEV